MSNTHISFAQRLKEENRTTHDSVDYLVMSVAPFADIARYTLFLKLQSVFHKIVEPIYQDAALNQRIPGLADMVRYAAVVRDLQDLGSEPYVFSGQLPQPAGNRAIGWLYCAEGSNLGAAFLFKDAQKLDFTAEYGARHLAPHPDGRGKHWREFVDYLNRLGLDKPAQDEAISGAKEAFACYKMILREIFGLPEDAEAPQPAEA